MLVNLLFCAVTLTLGNIAALSVIADLGLVQALIPGSALLLAFLAINIYPRRERDVTARLNVLMGGRRLVVTGLVSAILEAAAYVFVLARGGAGIDGLVLGINALIAAAVILTVVINGVIRVAVTARQVKAWLYIALVCLWWMPVINIIIVIRFCAGARGEYMYEKAKLGENEIRRENEICRTRYPVLLVHGIFFRDWQLVNYWGRIPAELIKNGAKIFYGGQQSAAAVAVSAQELSERITYLGERYGKINIIAHSKGGLDARCAISSLGMDKYVASLTTINTPHRGCEFVDGLMERMPEKVVAWLEKHYNGIYKKLGDREPDFLAGVKDLTAAACAVFNENTPDMPGVRYRSVMSKMGGFFSAPFPLNVGWRMVMRQSGDNDGLVDIQSACWGEDFAMIDSRSRRGVSHGDVVDLMRENLGGFDVREFYVKLVSELKERGF